MIQIQRREQFTKAADRLNREPQSIRRSEPHLYEVTNKVKGNTYHVRITRRDGQTFGSCTCKAGLRHNRRRPYSFSGQDCRAWPRRARRKKGGA